MTFRPDHNGECLNCDEWLDGHAEDGTCPTDEAQAVANVERYRAASAREPERQQVRDDDEQHRNPERGLPVGAEQREDERGQK